MAIRKTRESDNTGSNPGLTPIDDIHGSTSREKLDPDSTTGRLAQDDDESVTNGSRKSGTTRGGNGNSSKRGR